jgi:hypothetical protein
LLATEDGFLAIFERELAAQYALDDVAFDAIDEERMKKSVDEGRMAVI